MVYIFIEMHISRAKREAKKGSLLSCKVQAHDGNRIQFFVLELFTKLLFLSVT